MKHFERIVSGVDVSKINAVLDRWPELLTGEPLPPSALEIEAGTMRAIPIPPTDVSPTVALWLRWSPSAAVAPKPDISEIVYWARETVQTIVLVVGAVGVGFVSLHRLKAGHTIKPHTDSNGNFRFSRFHLVLTSTPRCLFTVDDETVHMAPGELWWFNHQLTHSVTNGGPDRVHLIFDAVTNTAFGWHRAEAAA